MRTEIALNGAERTEVRYVGWAPVPAAIRFSDTTGVFGPVVVKLRNKGTAKGGQVVFFSSIPGTGQAELQLTLPQSGKAVRFFVAGRFQRPSIEDRDVSIEVVTGPNNAVIGQKALMVRIRKNAMSLTTAERNRFISAFATLNNRGMGRFADFRNVHTSAGDPEAHGNPGFLPWHRSFLLDLERELQAVDPSVTLPYWRFDQPAPKVFNRDFMGVSDANASVQFSTSNPLQFWVTDGVAGINRRPLFNTGTQVAQSPTFGPVFSENATFNIGQPGATYSRFRRMEGNPHGTAHVSFTGSISDIPTAAKDPLFFMLHANVDRLWAKWQWLNRRFDAASATTFSSPAGTRVGHNLNDTMWPWNQITSPPRPATAPGGSMAPSPMTAAPGLKPTVKALIDYQGVMTPASRVGFDYDDVPFEFLNQP